MKEDLKKGKEKKKKKRDKYFNNFVQPSNVLQSWSSHRGRQLLCPGGDTAGQICRGQDNLNLPRRPGKQPRRPNAGPGRGLVDKVQDLVKEISYF